MVATTIGYYNLDSQHHIIDCCRIKAATFIAYVPLVVDITTITMRIIVHIDCIMADYVGSRPEVGSFLKVDIHRIGAIGIVASMASEVIMASLAFVASVAVKAFLASTPSVPTVASTVACLLVPNLAEPSLVVHTAHSNLPSAASVAIQDSQDRLAAGRYS